jgi:hypothetical protein
MADTTTYTRLAPYIEGAQENYIDLLTQQVGKAPGSAGVPTLAELGPQVASQNVLTQAAQQAAATQAGLGQLTFGPEGQVIGAGQGTGVAGYQPFLDQAAAYSGPQAYQPQLLQSLILKLHKVYHNLQRMLFKQELLVVVEKVWLKLSMHPMLLQKERHFKHSY